MITFFFFLSFFLIDSCLKFLFFSSSSFTFFVVLMDSFLALPKLDPEAAPGTPGVSPPHSPASQSDAAAFDDPRIFAKLNKVRLIPPYVLARRGQELSERALEHFLAAAPARAGVAGVHAEMAVEPGLSSSLVVYEASPSRPHDAVCAALAAAIARNVFVAAYVRAPTFVAGYGRAPDGCIVVPTCPCPPGLSRALPFVPQPSVLWEVAYDEPEATLCARLAEAVTRPALGNIRSAIGIKFDRVDPATNGGFSVGPRMVAIHCRRTVGFSPQPGESSSSTSTHGSSSGSSGTEEVDTGLPPLLAMKAEFGDVTNWGEAVLELAYSDIFGGPLMPDGSPLTEGSLLIDLFQLRSVLQPFIDGTELVPPPHANIDNYES